MQDKALFPTFRAQALLPALPALEPVEWASVPHLLPAMRALLASDPASAPHVAALVVAAFTAPELYVRAAGCFASHSHGSTA